MEMPLVVISIFMCLILVLLVVYVFKSIKYEGSLELTRVKASVVSKNLYNSNAYVPNYYVSNILYVVNFLLETGEEKEFFVCGSAYDGYNVGDEGYLEYKGYKLIEFEVISKVNQ